MSRHCQKVSNFEEYFWLTDTIFCYLLPHLPVGLCSPITLFNGLTLKQEQASSFNRDHRAALAVLQPSYPSDTFITDVCIRTILLQLQRATVENPDQNKYASLRNEVQVHLFIPCRLQSSKIFCLAVSCLKTHTIKICRTIINPLFYMDVRSGISP